MHNYSGHPIQFHCRANNQVRNGNIYYFHESRIIKALVLCDRGYELIGSPIILCYDHQWGTFPQCQCKLDIRYKLLRISLILATILFVQLLIKIKM